MSDLRLGAPIRNAGVTVVPVERVELQTLEDWGIYVSKAPVAVIISRDHHEQAFDSRGGELPINDFIEQFPQLTELLRTAK